MPHAGAPEQPRGAVPGATVGAVDAYVLSAFAKDEAATLEATLARAVEVMELAVGQGIQAAIDLTTKPQKKK